MWRVEVLQNCLHKILFGLEPAARPVVASLYQILQLHFIYWQWIQITLCLFFVILPFLKSQYFNDESHQWHIEDKMDSTAGISKVMRNSETMHLKHFINALDQVTSQFSCRKIFNNICISNVMCGKMFKCILVSQIFCHN